jgi:hypothetical protein
MEQTGALHQQLNREIIPPANIISFALTTLLSREKNVLKDSTLIRKLMIARTNARLAV